MLTKRGMLLVGGVPIASVIGSSDNSNGSLLLMELLIFVPIYVNIQGNWWKQVVNN